MGKDHQVVLMLNGEPSTYGGADGGGGVCGCERLVIYVTIRSV